MGKKDDLPCAVKDGQDKGIALGYLFNIPLQSRAICYPPCAVKYGQDKGRPGPSTRNKVCVNLLIEDRKVKNSADDISAQEMPVFQLRKYTYRHIQTYNTESWYGKTF